jgi:hypothetical protein
VERFEAPDSASAFATGEEVPDHDHTQQQRELIIYAIPLQRGQVGCAGGLLCCVLYCELWGCSRVQPCNRMSHALCCGVCCAPCLQTIFLPVCPWRTDPDAAAGWQKAVVGQVSGCWQPRSGLREQAHYVARHAHPPPLALPCSNSGATCCCCCSCRWTRCTTRRAACGRRWRLRSRAQRSTDCTSE